MAAWRSAGSAGNGTGSVTPGMPTGYQADDFFLCIVHTQNQNSAGVPTTTTGTWAHIDSQGTGTSGSGGVGTRLYWKRAVSSEGTTTVPDSGAYTHAIIHAYSGVDWDTGPFAGTTVGGVDAVSDTSGSATEMTTTADGALVVVVAGNGYDGTAAQYGGGFTNANLTGLSAARAPQQWLTQGGGGYTCCDGTKTAAGATGATTWTQANASYKTFHTLALRPQGPVTANAGQVTGSATAGQPAALLPPKVTVTFVMDDARESQTNLRQIFADHGVHASLYVNSAWVGAHPAPGQSYNVMTWEEIAAFAADGNEIASHTANHYQYSDLATWRREIAADIRTLVRDHGYPWPDSFSYPVGTDGTTAGQAVADAGIFAAHLGDPDLYEYESMPPANGWLYIRMPQNSMPTSAQLSADVAACQALGGRSWLMYITHEGYSPIDTDLHNCLDWCASNGIPVKSVREVYADEVKYASGTLAGSGAVGWGEAPQPTVTTAVEVIAYAGQAAASGQAPAAQVPLSVTSVDTVAVAVSYSEAAGGTAPAGPAGAAGTAPQSYAQPGYAPPAGPATAGAAAPGPGTSLTLPASAGTADGQGGAPQPSVTVSGAEQATPPAPAGTGSAPAPSVTATLAVTAAGPSGAASVPQAAAQPALPAAAGQATAAGTGPQPAVTGALTVTAGQATATGTGPQPTGSTAEAGTAQPGPATAAATAPSPAGRPALTGPTGQATGAAAAPQPGVRVTVTAGLATAAAAAAGPGLTLTSRASAGPATGAGSAPHPAPAAAVTAGNATAAATAPAPALALAAQAAAQAATALGEVLGPQVRTVIPALYGVAVQAGGPVTTVTASGGAADAAAAGGTTITLTRTGGQP